MTGGGSHSLGPSLSGGVVHHQDPLHPERGLVPRWLTQRGHGHPLALWLACSVIALPPSRHRVAEHGLMLIPLPPDEHIIARKGGRCLAMAPPAAVESSPQVERPECSPIVIRLW
jgi:hypothetical protein